MALPDRQDIKASAAPLVLRNGVPVKLEVPVEASDTGAARTSVLELKRVVLDHINNWTHHVRLVPTNPVE